MVTEKQLRAALLGQRPVQVRSHSSQQTQELAARLAHMLTASPAGTLAPGPAPRGRGEVVALSGDLGTGKTTFVKGFCQALGVVEKITSPTFTLLHIYHGTHCPIYHFDFYRLRSFAEVAVLGCEEYFDGEGISLVEWPEVAGPLLPPHALRVTLRMVDFIAHPENRVIEIMRRSP